jgi:putative transposase
MHVHLIFVTKYRRKIFDADAIERLTGHFTRVANDFEAKVVQCNGEDNHMHVLVEYHPKISVSSLVRSMKGVSSRMLRQERPDIAVHYYKDVLWSPSYFAASCGGAPLEIIKKYVEQQNRPL